MDYLDRSNIACWAHPRQFVDKIKHFPTQIIKLEGETFLFTNDLKNPNITASTPYSTYYLHRSGHCALEAIPIWELILAQLKK